MFVLLIYFKFEILDRNSILNNIINDLVYFKTEQTT